VIRRETQTPTFWHNYQVSDLDLEYITTLFIEHEQPLSVDQLALAVMRYRCRQEDELIKRKLSKGVLFQPRNSYEEEQTLVFPALGYAVGEIVAIRPGHNPEYGEFRVARVRLEDQSKEREYAIELQAPHRLNFEGDAIAEDGLLSPEELYDLHSAPVREALEAYIKQGDELVGLAGRWFLKELLLEISAGQLNLAEAVLDMADGGPLPTKAFLKDLDLPAEVDEQLRIFSLDYAFTQDERFDEVGSADQVLWFLRAREPSEVLFAPRRLEVAFIPYDYKALDTSLVMLERELEDEWSEVSYAPVDEADQATLILTFPHRRVGTLPLTPRLKTLFPTGRAQHIRFIFKDGTTGDTWPGWVVHEHRYVFGLDKWYQSNNLPVGAYIELKRGAEPGVVEIDFQRRKPVREWVRVAATREGHVAFEMRKQLIGCEYDELMIVATDDPTTVDQVWIQAEERDYPVVRILYDVFPELAKLNPQGTVHAKTLYSAVNVVRRLPPGPIFAVLMEDMAFLPVGDNYWLYTKK
jgi:hypothetical protein